ncbi:hypothetical protein HEP85_43940 [Streptomyces sp. RPA4-2]|nr:hypothetical protein [Streptomyces sp. RPA4-2]
MDLVSTRVGGSEALITRLPAASEPAVYRVASGDRVGRVRAVE